MQWARRSLQVVQQRCFSSVHHGRYYPEMYGLLRKDKVSVQEAFDVLKQRTNPFDYRGCDSFYFSCLEQVPLPKEFVKDIVHYFQRVLDEDARGPNDGAFSSMIGILAHHGEPDLAYSLLKQKYEKNTNIQPYYRSYSPLLEYYIQVKDLEKAWAFWEYIKSINTTQPLDKVGPSMVLFAIAALEKDKVLFRKIIHELNELRYQLTPDDVAKWLNGTSHVHGWKTTLLPEEPNTPICSHCNQTLNKLTITSSELNTLLDTVKTMCLESRYIPSDPKAVIPKPMSRQNKLKALKSFEDWLRKRHEMVKPGKLHYILDGPNIAYLNQNFEGGAYRFDHIDKLAKQLQVEGHVASVTMPAYYFEEISFLSVKSSKRNPYKRSGTRYFRKRTPEDKAFLDSWEKQNLAFRAEREVASDDLYWMYGTFYLMSLNVDATENIVRVVSNDEIKDHIVNLVESHHISRDLIERWKSSACVGVSLTFEKSVTSVVLQHPLPFSRVVQDQGNSFHLPTDQASWLCVSGVN
ncbi:hypothetical protein THRCLA_10830 [Thraustotheca clavata]|uniref:ribonuclease P n=1 Tax=Thraustotheca clavata TaxID=74557 RepID=A0A1V9YF57_9STRA|nr:hypothetical protein THRCLA_10830 [Thraustotheca clavata]